MKNVRTWHSGPPPHIGWWVAGLSRHLYVWRWWDGKHWSAPLVDTTDAHTAGWYAKERSSISAAIEWTDYWPENARVPRLDPTDGHWTFRTDLALPGPGKARVDVVFRDGLMERNVRVSRYDWLLDNQPFDIVAWRPA